MGSEAAEESAHHNSIPRFELTAGAAAAEFYNKYHQEVQNDPKEIYFWTDSECFLKQLRNRSGRHATFVRNSLSKIRSLTDLKGWHYVDTKNNPADIASRGLKAGDKEGWNIYHHGPHFLRDPQWVPPEAPEEVWVAAVAEQEPPKGPETAPAFILEVAARKDRWADKVRLIARLKRCANKWLKKGPLEQRDPRAALSAQELEEARWDIWRELQKTHFPKEVNFLREKGIRTAEARTTARLPKSQLRKLNPFLDQHGLIRSSTRLLNAQGLTYNEKCPIVLPKRHDTVDALIRECHIRHAHMGVEFVKNTLRKEFLIMADGQAVRRVIGQCAKCQKLFKQPTTQQMAPLPKDRVEAGAPFEVTGADLFGPYELLCGRRVAAKRWVVIFTCLKVRAVHFEIVETISAPSLLNAIIRFRSRFPGVRKLWSDAGTNFVGAEKLLEKALITAKERGEQNPLPIEWQRVPPHAPHRAGVWERLVKSAKRILAALLGKQDVSLDVFRTVLHQAEYILNHRPITQVSSDPRDMEALTPAHFIHPGIQPNLPNQCEPLGHIGVEDMRFAHNRAIALIGGFWKRWLSDYLSQLKGRKKWQQMEKELQVGQLTLLMDDTKARKDWKLARVEATSGSDGLVRTVQVRTANGKLFERAVTQVIPLELD